jgi:Tol biopolymer transport system component
MVVRRTRALLALVLVAGFLAAGTSLALAATPAGATALASVTSTGASVRGFGAYDPRLSSTGRWVAFDTEAGNVVANDTNRTWDVFLRDRSSGTTTRVSTGVAGTQSDGASFGAALSAGGRFVAFESEADNLVIGDSNHVDDVFVRDMQTGLTERISVARTGAQANGFSSSPAISARGRFVAFYSNATNLVRGDTNGHLDVFVHDRLTGSTQRVSVSGAERQANRQSQVGVGGLSANGRYVAFESYATNLVRGDTNRTWDVYVRDRVAGTTRRVSVTSRGAQVHGVSELPAISGDGRIVAFDSDADDIVRHDTNRAWDVFTANLRTGAVRRASVATGGGQAAGDSTAPSISADGKYVAFDSEASDLVPGDTNRTGDVFLRDRLDARTGRVSVSNGEAQADDRSWSATISADGRHVGFASWADNLVPSDANGQPDVFVRDLT